MAALGGGVWAGLAVAIGAATFALHQTKEVDPALTAYTKDKLRDAASPHELQDAAVAHPMLWWWAFKPRKSVRLLTPAWQHVHHH
jgi:hypothetical protein